MHIPDALFFVLGAIIVFAGPTVTGSEPSLSPSITTSNATDNFLLHCFTPFAHPDRKAINATECKKAVRLLVLSPGFTKEYKFSKNKRRFDVISLPRGWQSGDCLIMLSCENDLDSSVFRLSDVARQANKIMEACVLDGETPYGGVVGVSDVTSFYVSIGKPLPVGHTAGIVITASTEGDNSTALNVGASGRSSMVLGIGAGGNNNAFLQTERIV